jgi:hypothetical protein
MNMSNRRIRNKRGTMAKKSKKLGRLSIGEMRNLINKKAGIEVAFDLTKDNPTQVKSGSQPALGGLTVLSVAEN